MLLRGQSRLLERAGLTGLEQFCQLLKGVRNPADLFVSCHQGRSYRWKDWREVAFAESFTLSYLGLEREYPSPHFLLGAGPGYQLETLGDISTTVQDIGQAAAGVRQGHGVLGNELALAEGVSGQLAKQALECPAEIAGLPQLDHSDICLGKHFWELRHSNGKRYPLQNEPLEFVQDRAKSLVVSSQKRKYATVADTTFDQGCKHPGQRQERRECVNLCRGIVAIQLLKQKSQVSRRELLSTGYFKRLKLLFPENDGMPIIGSFHQQSTVVNGHPEMLSRQGLVESDEPFAVLLGPARTPAPYPPRFPIPNPEGRLLGRLDMVGIHYILLC